MISLAPVPRMNARNAPNAALRAFVFPEMVSVAAIVSVSDAVNLLLRCVWMKLFINSPESAPMKGPAISPMGAKKNIPANIPMIEPITAVFEPPNFFVIIAGRKLSIIITAKVMTAHTHRNTVLKLPNLLKLIITKPKQHRGGPGNIGTTEPRKPTAKNKNASIIRTISISFPLVY